MRRLLFIVVTITSFVLSACTSNPSGLPSPRSLTDAEKQNAVRIALGTPEAKQQLANGAQYTADVRWAAIIWKGTGYAMWEGISADWSTDPNRALIPAGAQYYIDVLVDFGQPAYWQVYVDIAPDSGKVALLQQNPFNNGPAAPAKPIPIPPPSVRPAPPPILN